MKWVAGVEYVGTKYCGWQAQTHSNSVQANIDRALSFVAGKPVTTICSGRTDTGVHAKEQIIHFESDAERSEYGWRMGCNTRLPNDIRLLWCHTIDARFHARFSALARSYRYVIYNSEADSALLNERVLWQRQALDEQAMHVAAQSLLGENDFSSFQASSCQSNTPFRNIHQIKVSREEDFVFVDIKANAFLHHMVRNIVGTLLEVGMGKQAVEWVAEVLKNKDRNTAGATASASGLYFIRAHYPETFVIKQRPMLKPIFIL